MRIYEVIQESDALYENNIPQEQKVKWCDELGALWKNEYAKEYSRIQLTKSGAEFYLPEGADTARIVMLIADGKEVTKGELKDWGYTITPMTIFPAPGSAPVYRLSYLYHLPYEPISDILEDETEAYAPYDRMYVEYIIAKCNYYNRDFEGYNQHMTYFNSLLKMCLFF